MRYKATTTDLIIFQNMFYNGADGKPLDPIETQNYHILQVADSHYLSEFTIGNHKQYCDVEITYVLRNHVINKTAETPIKTMQGEAYLSLRGDLHSLESMTNCRFLTLALDFKENSVCKTLFERLIAEHSSPEQRVFKLPALEPFFTQIVAEFFNPEKDCKHLALDSLITVILTHLARRQSVALLTDNETLRELLPRVVNYIDVNFRSLESLEEIANSFGYSHNYLYKLFKSYYGETLQEYVTRKKMEHAKKLLFEKKSVEEISTELGYTSPYNFSRAFKKYYGISPSKLN